MRRAGALGVLLIAVLAAGCGEARDDAAPPQVGQAVEWRLLPASLMVPQVEIPDVPAAARGGEPAARAGDVSPGAPTDAEVRRELAQLYGSGAVLDQRRVSLDGGLAEAPPDAPRAVHAIVAAANQVARLPYVYGGGHGRAEGLFVDSAYDCSGSISFALASAGLLESPMASTGFMRWGRPGPGKWVTIYANEGHAWMTVGGARFDTSGLRETGSRWQSARRSTEGFVVRHPPGL